MTTYRVYLARASASLCNAKATLGDQRNHSLLVFVTRIPNADLIIGKVTRRHSRCRSIVTIFHATPALGRASFQRTLVFPCFRSLIHRRKIKGGERKKCVSKRSSTANALLQSHWWILNVDANRSGGFCERTQRIDRSFSSLLARSNYS